MSVLWLACVLAALVEAIAPDAGITVGELSTVWEHRLGLDQGEYATGETADLDGDGTLEVLIHVGHRDAPSRAVALDGETGERLWVARFPKHSDSVAADLDGDGACEVVVACGDSVYALTGSTGAYLSRRGLRGAFGELASCRLSGEGDSVVCTSGDGRGDVLAGFTGTELEERWSVESEPGEGRFRRGFAWPTAVDVDGDGTEETVAAENGGRLRCVSARGETMWTTVLGVCERLNPEGVLSSSPVVADLLPGGSLELAAGCFAGAVLVLDAETGAELSRGQFGRASHDRHIANTLIPAFIRRALGQTGEPVNCLTAVDVDGVQGEDLLLGCSDGHLYAWSPSREALIWTLDTDGNLYEPCVPVRERRSERPLVLAWDEKRAYAVRTGDGSALPLFGDRGAAGGLLVEDLDEDGKLELVRIESRSGRVSMMTTELEAWREH
jgi:outer membrane protein assembly factor BamB